MTACTKLKRFITYAAPKGIWFGLGVAATGAYQQAYENGSALWSGAYGYPLLHHYALGFIVLSVSLLIYQYKTEQIKVNG
jgi:hypothetical protein